MKVLFINHTGIIGGAERSLLELLAYLPALGVEPFLAAPQGPLTEELAGTGLPGTVLPLMPLAAPRSMAKRCFTGRALIRNTALTWRLLRNYRPDIVHANSAKAAWSAVTAARLQNIPLLWHCRDLAPPGTKALQRLCKLTIATSEYVKLSLPSSRRIRTVVNGIDLLSYDPAKLNRIEARSRLQLPADCPLVIMVADLVPWKKHGIFLETAALIRRSRSDVQFVIAGRDRGEHPDLAGRLRVKTAELGLSRSVRWLGHCRDTASLYAAADLLLHPATEEPFGRVVCEALAMGCKVVVADSGGPAAIVGDCPAGKISAADPSSFAAAVLNSLEKPADRTAGRKHVIKYFNVARTSAGLTRIYRELCPSDRAG